MSFRKEKKFRLSISDFKFLKYDLFKKGMNVLYPKRIIYSCYFDTNNLQMFHESEEGILPRKKMRYRWYSNSSKINKELKISSIEGRFKEIQKMDISPSNCFENSNNFLKGYGLIYPSLFIKYEREYYNFKNIRLTFDSNIEYKDLRKKINKKFKDLENVMEIKTSIDTSDDHIENIISINQSRFSKYCRGISNFYKNL